jgi:hypothetical protein
MIQIEIVFSNGHRRKVLLAGVPRVGEHIRFNNGPGATPSYVVEHVLWLEGTPEPDVVVAVRQYVDGPKG